MNVIALDVINSAWQKPYETMSWYFESLEGGNRIMQQVPQITAGQLILLLLTDLSISLTVTYINNKRLFRHK